MKTASFLKKLAVFGPSGATRTRGFHIPNVAPYQLGYTRIFACHDYSTNLVRFKVFSCLWSFMWSNPFFVPVLPEGKILQVLVSQRVPPFCLWEPRIRRLRSQKPPALPTALIPAIDSFFNNILPTIRDA